MTPLCQLDGIEIFIKTNLYVICTSSEITSKSFKEKNRNKFKKHIRAKIIVHFWVHLRSDHVIKKTYANKSTHTKFW